MAASSTNSWLQTTLLSPSAQQQSAQHALYATDLPIHPSSHSPQQQHVHLGHDGHSPFCQLHQCPLSLDFHHSVESHQLDFSRPSGGSCSGHVGAGGDSGGHVSARKVHKADREKLRRDRLNEQFAELAGVLDPDRPKNDKATILADSVQVVKELRSEVKRLRSEQTSLLDESRDLAQEKTELREEKAALKSETEHLQGQLQQRLCLMLPWMAMDPSVMMGGPPFGYPMPVPQPVSAPPSSSDSNPPASQGSIPQSVATPPSYIPLAQTAQAAFALHPALQAYTMYGNRPGDGSTPYLPYSHYPPHLNSHSHVERPYAQYPTPIQPHPSYLMQMHPHQGQSPMSGGPPAPSMYQSFAPGMPPIPSRTPVSQPNVPSRGTNSHPVAPSSHYGASGLHSYPGHSAPMFSVQTTLQLQTPLHPQPQRLAQVNPVDGTDASAKAQTGVTGSSVSKLPKESQSGVQDAPIDWPGGSNSSAHSPIATASPVLCSPGASSTGSGRDAVGPCGRDIGDSLEKDAHERDDPTLRPPAA